MSVSFKDFINKDLETFINPLEFGDIHRLDGKELLMIVEEETVDSKKGLTDAQEDAAQGIFEASVVLYLKASDYKKPSVGRRVELDRKQYYVADASVSDGMLKIVLIANES